MKNSKILAHRNKYFFSVGDAEEKYYKGVKGLIDRAREGGDRFYLRSWGKYGVIIVWLDSNHQISFAERFQTI